MVSSIDLGRLKINELEKEVKEFWRRNEIPRKWRSWTGDKPIFSFLEGPPTANGVPHVGHLRGRIYKDFVLKYFKLKGFDVWAQAGWDEQGLPVEVEVEKTLGVKSKKELGSRISLEEFIRKCNELVDHYLVFWSRYATEDIALWLDLENAYETRRPKYIEHVWYLMKKAYEKGLLYEGYRVLPFCPRCETVLSDAEVDQGYEEKTSPSIIVKFKLTQDPNTYLLIWTTTPWTLVDNEAVAVNPKGMYCKYRVKDEYWILAENRSEYVFSNAGLQGVECVERFLGEKLAGLEYVHPFLEEVPTHKQHANAHKVYVAEFVSLDEGTGLVHIAPGHGPEDYELGVKHDLPITSSVEINGVFNEDGGVFKGLSVDEASKEVIKLLKGKGLLIYSGSVRHAYPHCWRCHTPLIYRADRQWFLKISAIRDELMKELSKVKIYPVKLRDRFDNWVANAKDWTISRSRFWGTPLPIWRCKDNPTKILIVGGIDELRRVAINASEFTDDMLTHRPWIDKLRIKTNDCSEWVREPFVIDVWIDSGVAWIAGVDGLRNGELFAKLFPYNFITEAVDQTRGWFYSLLTTSVLLTGRAPYKEILIQGHVLDKYGRKMSKHLGNVIYAEDAIKKFGVDPLRLYILSTYPPGDPFMFNADEVKDSLTTMNIIWNIFRFAHTYMSLDKFNPREHTLKKLMHRSKPEDLWILSKVNTTARNFEEYIKNYNIHLAVKELTNFFIEYLSHRYLRLVRPRVWAEESEDRYVVYAVLYYVLKKALKLLAPALPHLAEALWQKFFKVYEKDLEESIHLSVFEGIDEDLINKELEEDFDLIFEVSSIVAALRNTAGLKLRWPVRKVYVGSDENVIRRLSKYLEVISFLTNSKQVELMTSLPDVCVNDSSYISTESKGFKVCIPKLLDKELLHEALSREIIRRIQVMRNKANLNVDEYIEVSISTDDPEVGTAVDVMKEYIMKEVRAQKLSEAFSDDMFIMEWDVEGVKVKIGIKRVTPT